MVNRVLRERLLPLLPWIDREPFVYVLRYPKVWRAVSLFFLGLAILVVLFYPRRYLSVVVFVPETPQSSTLPASLAGFAGQFGISVGGSDPTQSPLFYRELLTSRRILLAAAQDSMPHEYRGARSVLDLLSQDGRDSMDLDRLIRTLRSWVSVAVDSRTNITTLTVMAPDPDWAAALATGLFKHLSEYNIESRQSQARSRRIFLEERLTTLRQDLAAAEDLLRTFYTENRQWQNAPALVFREGALRRQVDLRQNIFTSLATELERAKLDEVNSVPVLSVIDPAVPHARPARPRPIPVLAMSFLGAVVSSAIVSILLSLGNPVAKPTHP